MPPLRSTLVAIAASAALVPLAGPAHAEPAAAVSCVTAPAFDAVRVGDTKAAVARVFGTRGWRVSIRRGARTVEVRNYLTCVPFGSVSVKFVDGVLRSKVSTDLL